MNNESKAIVFLATWGWSAVLLAVLMFWALWAAGAFADDGAGATVAITGSLAAGLLVARQVLEIIAKLIPDSAGGWLGTVRKLAKIFSGYVVNKQ